MIIIMIRKLKGREKLGCEPVHLKCAGSFYFNTEGEICYDIND